MTDQSPLQIDYCKVKDLDFYARNARTHSDEQVGQIAGSIREFGFTNPVLIDGENGIIAGHGRVLAAQRLGMGDVPCVRLAHMTDAQKRAYILADNQLALNAGWDDALRSLELGELRDEGFDLDLIGIPEDELALLLADGDSDAAEPKDLSDNAERLEVVIECADESEQERAYNFAQSKGFKCRISTF